MRTFNQKCKGSKSICNCAVAVKSGDDVYVVDKCDQDDMSALKLRKYMHGDGIPGTRVLSFEDGNELRVSYINMFIQMSLKVGGGLPVLSNFYLVNIYLYGLYIVPKLSNTVKVLYFRKVIFIADFIIDSWGLKV